MLEISIEMTDCDKPGGNTLYRQAKSVSLAAAVALIASTSFAQELIYKVGEGGFSWDS